MAGTVDCDDTAVTVDSETPGYLPVYTANDMLKPPALLRNPVTAGHTNPVLSRLTGHPKTMHTPRTHKKKLRF
ncbi:hypothetical protein BaRGS_00009470 [Batillaria attramentaria]|uniref:Uncharacterized protein n=1 Tax=Batillaria attramentaria TaxID=370345 RepID=A0ABD0LIF1_9CAEN